jgi:hypothetical protein
MKKKNLIRIIKILCLLLCVALLSCVANDFCRYYDHNGSRVVGFYAEPENSLDVVLMGASEIFTGFSPGYAYGLYGFTSYSYAMDAMSCVFYESQLKEILKHQDPELIVIEINGVLYDDPAVHTDNANLLRYLHNIPFSWNKIQSIYELVPEGDRYYYFFPLAKYHGNWKEVLDQGGKMKDHYEFYRNGTKLKGNTTIITPFVEHSSRDVSQDRGTAPLEEKSEAYLRSFLEFCREQGLDNVVFARFPHAISTDRNYDRFQRGNRAQEIIEEYGYPVVNLERDAETFGIDFSRDFYNTDHLNLYGQKKLTEHFGKILVEEYAVSGGWLDEEQRRGWEEAARYTDLFYAYGFECMENGVYDLLYETRDLIRILDEYGS